MLVGGVGGLQSSNVARIVAENVLASPLMQAGQPSNMPMSPSARIESATQGLEDLKISQDSKNSKDAESEAEQSSLFVGDLARNCSEEQLRGCFAKYGEVVHVDIKRDKVTNNNLGYGFVQMKTREQALAAKNGLDGTDIAQRKVRIGWAQKNTTLFIGDLDGTITSDRLKEIFSKYGPLVDEETFVKGGNGKFGFVRFKNRVDAEKAKAEMNRQPVGARQLRIGWGDNTLQKHCVHVQFNPQLLAPQQQQQGAAAAAAAAAQQITEQTLQKAFEKYGTITNITLPRYVHNKRLKGYAFIHYQENDSGEKAASQAILAMSEGKINGIPIRCSYGKRQNRKKQQFRHVHQNAAGGPMHAGPGGFRPMYGWTMIMGPNGNWIQVPAQYAPPAASGDESGSPPSNPAAAPYYPISPQQSPMPAALSPKQQFFPNTPQYYPQQMYFPANGYFVAPPSPNSASAQPPSMGAQSVLPPSAASSAAKPQPGAKPFQPKQQGGVQPK